jgi:peptidoglycan hydrolase CwlO-like protein
MFKMNKMLVMLAILVVISTVFVSGCIQQGSVTTDEQAEDTIDEVNEEVTDILSDLSDMDSGLGSE